MENIDKINFLGIYAKHIHYMLNRIHCEQNIFRGQIHELLDSSVSFVVSNVARLSLQLSLTFIHRKDSNIILRFYFPWLSLEIRTSRHGPLIKQEAFIPLNRQFLLPASDSSYCLSICYFVFVVEDFRIWNTICTKYEYTIREIMKTVSIFRNV
jgi:hypothetical protein